MRRSIMKKQHRWAPWLLILILAAVGAAQDNPRVLSVSLEDCIARTLKNNLGLAIQVLNPEISRSSVSRSNEKFLPSFTFGATQQHTDSPSVTYIDAAGNLVTDSANYTFLQASQSLPFGGTLNL